MKLREKWLLDDLRKRYFQGGWKHEDVRVYLRNLRVEVSVRTLKRWKKHLRDPAWAGPVAPVPPKPRAVSAELVSRVCRLRRLTGWGSYPIRHLCNFQLSESSCKRIIRLNGLSRGSMTENQRVHWVKWQREHPDSLWQLDSWQKTDGSWVMDVIDDCSRFCLGIRETSSLTTDTVTQFLDELIRIHGAPREILTDNGAEHGQKSKTSTFDDWCKQKGIVHIRSRIHKPTTAGKVERFHQTVQQELPYCDNDYELFRYRYNHMRPHRSLLGRRPAEVYFDPASRLKTTESTQQKWWG